jgi:excisionase family DNA binding protein
MSTQKLLSVKEASKYLSVKESRLRTAVFKGEIPHLKLGRLVRFEKKELSDWLGTLSVKIESKQERFKKSEVVRKKIQSKNMTTLKNQDAIIQSLENIETIFSILSNEIKTLKETMKGA